MGDEVKAKKKRKYDELSVAKSIQFLLSKLQPSAQVRVINFVHGAAQDAYYASMQPVTGPARGDIDCD